MRVPASLSLTSSSSPAFRRCRKCLPAARRHQPARSPESAGVGRTGGGHRHRVRFTVFAQNRRNQRDIRAHTRRHNFRRVDGLERVHAGDTGSRKCSNRTRRSSFPRRAGRFATARCACRPDRVRPASCRPLPFRSSQRSRPACPAAPRQYSVPADAGSCAGQSGRLPRGRCRSSSR